VKDETGNTFVDTFPITTIGTICPTAGPDRRPNLERFGPDLPEICHTGFITKPSVALLPRDGWRFKSLSKRKLDIAFVFARLAWSNEVPAALPG
jgi:hypothetical protein